MELDNILSNLVRQGRVTAVDPDVQRVRVVYETLGNLSSGWLPVLQHSGMGVSVDQDGSHSHTITDTFTGGGTASTNGGHTHEAQTTKWLPKTGDRVLVLYLPVADGDGFVLGGI